jgi:hypothetical protein
MIEDMVHMNEHFVLFFY